MQDRMYFTSDPPLAHQCLSPTCKGRCLTRGLGHRPIRGQNLNSPKMISRRSDPPMMSQQKSICLPQNGAQQPFVPMGNLGDGDIMNQFKISRKGVELTKFNGQMASWKHCKSKLIDHCAESTTRWKRILKNWRGAKVQSK